jgi:GAF domain-containing protein
VPKLPLDELSLVVARIQGVLLTEEKVDHAVRLLARAVRVSLPGATGAGVTILDSRGRRVSSGATDDIVKRADALQYELGQGPCLTAWASEEAVIVTDVSIDPRWPDWRESVRNLPVKSATSVPLVAGNETIGAMKVYSDRPGSFGDETVLALELFAGPAATLLSNIQASETPHRISEALAESLHSRDLINRACGVLMERHNISHEVALTQLMRTSREQKTTLRKTSADILAGNPATQG